MQEVPCSFYRVHRLMTAALLLMFHYEELELHKFIKELILLNIAVMAFCAHGHLKAFKVICQHFIT